MSITVLGITFHAYGFVIGVAAVISYWLSGKVAKQLGITEQRFTTYWLVGLLSGVVGARLFYVLTDLRGDDVRWWEALAAWQGGLSIIGGVIGGAGGLWLYNRYQKKPIKLATVVDSAVFGLPFAQAFGRLGNWLNQELYGLPTNLPWGIFIDAEHRASGYEQVSFFHPLFAYEALAMAGFGLLVWRNWSPKQRKLLGIFSGVRMGSGGLFLVYVFYYSFVRFWLDFLRINKTHFFDSFIGVNQLILLGVMISITVVAVQSKWRTYAKK